MEPAQQPDRHLQTAEDGAFGGGPIAVAQFGDEAFECVSAPWQGRQFGGEVIDALLITTDRPAAEVGKLSCAKIVENAIRGFNLRSEEHTSELQSLRHLV